LVVAQASRCGMQGSVSVPTPAAHIADDPVVVAKDVSAIILDVRDFRFGHCRFLYLREGWRAHDGRA